MGTPEFAVPSLRAVAQACSVAAVVTQPDRPRGRGRAAAPSAVASTAEALRLETLKPEHVNAPEWVERLRGFTPDLLAVVAYGAILGRALLALPRLGAINLHGSLLPEYRGASPVQRALWDGRVATGVTTIWMDEGVDTGDVILQRWAPIEPTDHAGTLAARLAELGAPLLAESLMRAHAGDAPRGPQDRAAGSYAPRLAKQDGIVDWALDAEAVWHRQRAVTPWPGATARFRDARVLITRSEPLHRLDAGVPPGTIVGARAAGVDVACARGVLRLLRLKPEGRAEMAASDWAHGVRPEAREHFEHMEIST
jgi:methionyl-tRNA formyltransferase